MEVSDEETEGNNEKRGAAQDREKRGTSRTRLDERAGDDGCGRKHIRLVFCASPGVHSDCVNGRNLKTRINMNQLPIFLT